jgi:hypothetical protein
MGSRKVPDIDDVFAQLYEEQCAAHYGDAWPRIKAEQEEDRRRREQAVDRYNSDWGLSQLEAVLGLHARGEQLSRIDDIVNDVVRKVSAWEAMTPTALIKHDVVMSALFAVQDKAHVSRVVNNGRLPDFWWARLAIRLDEVGIYDRLSDQIHRETQARMAQGILSDERGMGGKAKGANSSAGRAKEAAKKLWPEANRKGWTAAQFHAALTGRGHSIAFDTVRKWMTALRRTGTC